MNRTAGRMSLTLGEKQNHGGDDKQGPGHKATGDAVQQPPDVNCQLLRFRARQQNAVVQDIQGPCIADPALAFHHLMAHHGDLPGRPAEADKSKF